MGGQVGGGGGREQLCRRMPRIFISSSQFQRKSKSLVVFQSINFLWQEGFIHTNNSVIFFSTQYWLARWKYQLFLKILAETHLSISTSAIGRFSSMSPSLISAGKNLLKCTLIYLFLHCRVAFFVGDFYAIGPLKRAFRGWRRNHCCESFSKKQDGKTCL